MKRMTKGWLPVLVVAMAALPGLAHAAGTASGTNVDNWATVDYTVGGIAQTQVLSDTASFVVDNRIDLSVATVDVAPVTVIPGSSDQIQTFTVTNEGNTTQDYSLAATDSPTPAFGESSEDFDGTNVRVFVDANGNGTYESGTDTGTYIDELEADSSVTVFVLADIPLSTADGEVASYDLTATTAVGGTSSSQGADITSDDAAAADNPAVVQTVFADGAGTTDGANDGQHSSKDAYKVESADLTIDKSALVTNDPINGGTNPKAIPGATMDYSIQVDNNGTSAADTVEVTDAIPSNTSFLVGSVSTTPAAGPTVEYSDDNGSTWTYTPVAGGDGSDPNVTHVRVTFVTIAASGSGQVDFQVLIL